MHTALTIAGSDSSGGAGIQADLKTFAACGVYGTCAITAITAQNTTGVTAWQALEADLVIAQIEAVVEDFGVKAAKTGMLANAAIVEAVAATIQELGVPNLVVDPVMVAKGGDRLLDEDAVHAMRLELLPRAEIVTPNIPEAEVIAGMAIANVQDMGEAGRRIRGLGPRVVLVKGGHLAGDTVVDVIVGDGEQFELRGQRLPGRHTHGTGCTLSAAIAAFLARGHSVRESIEKATTYVRGAIANAPGLGHGHGPLGHFWAGILKHE